jgi:amino acid adenylation domain-containing protein/non-ribosomal peptide synthase protein (TIGR01720 family)
MSELAKRVASLSVAKRALLAQELAARLDALEAERREPIAIIGMACRFPGGASDPEAFWRLLRSGADAVREVPAERWNAEEYFDPDPRSPGKTVGRTGGFLDSADGFDAHFFHISPHEAERMDPQHRWVLEVAWEALESAAQPPEALVESATGVFLGVTGSEYLHALGNDGLPPSIIDGALGMGIVAGMAAGRLAHFLGTQGPCLTVDTLCSSSLVCVHLACQSLRNRECDLALAGGVQAMLSPLASIFLSQAGALAPDGRCKAFDASANGYGRGEGCGMVVLKRLSDAIAERDNILAVIRGSAVNHDGRSAGPGVPNGLAQAKVLRAALASSGLAPGDVDYVEAHGTGTPLGDPIEVRALADALRGGRGPDRPLWLGSVKSNIGHTEAAAGIAGLIKTVLALRHRTIPPHLHFKEASPHLCLDEIPARIPVEPIPWPRANGTRVAGVSSFGLGGTNAHVVVAEAEAGVSTSASRSWQLLCVSANTRTALDAAALRLVRHLRDTPEVSLPDVAYTLQTGRKAFVWRRALVCRDRDEAIAALEGRAAPLALGGERCPAKASVAFALSGVGEQSAETGGELYRTERPYREAVDECCELLTPLLGFDLRDILFQDDLGRAAGRSTSGDGGSNAAYVDLRRMVARGGTSANRSDRLHETILSQPAVFVADYALARLWMAWGISPDALIGYSVGELVAACLAGVFSLPDALRFVAERARLVDRLPRGAMLAVNAPADKLQLVFDDGREGEDGKLALAAVNAPSHSVVAGPVPAIERAEGALAAAGYTCRRVEASHAFHSSMLEPAAAPLAELVASFERRPPKIPFISNVTGDWITDEEATSPAYWARHLCATVRFAEGIERLCTGDRVVLEVGPGNALTSFVLQSGSSAGRRVAVPSLPARYERRGEAETILRALGKLWLAGVQPSWAGFYADEQRRRVALPTYPFERQPYWLRVPASARTRAVTSLPPQPVDDWFSVPVWRQAPLPPCRSAADGRHAVVFVDALGVGRALAAELSAEGGRVSIVLPGDGFRAVAEGVFEVEPGKRAAHDALLAALREEGAPPTEIYHLRTLDELEALTALDAVEQAQSRGFYDLLALVQALAADDPTLARRVVVASRGTHEVMPGDALRPAYATLVGPCRVAAAEQPGIACTLVDLEATPDGATDFETLVRALVGEARSPSAAPIVALRASGRWVPEFEAVRLESWLADQVPLRTGGVYVVTGGLGGIGLAMAGFLAQRVRARLALIARTPLPERRDWDAWLEGHPEDDPASGRIRAIREMEEAGAQVRVFAADVGDVDVMRAALDDVRRELGSIAGVLHAAGVPGAGLIALKDHAEAAAVLHPKVRGTMVLEEVLGDEPLDFLLLFGSVFSALGGIGQVDYCAANAFLDTFACERTRRRPGRTVCIAWGAWKWDAWQDRLLAGMPHAQRLMREFRDRWGIGFADGAQAMLRALGAALPRVVVSTQSVDALSEQMRALTLAGITGQLGTDVPRHQRPALSTAFVPPQDERQAALAEIWKSVLGLEEIGIHDDFLELGGNSLLATQILARVSAEMHVDLTVNALFAAPTIAALAETLARTDGRDEEDEPLVPVPREAALPLSPPQERLWYIHHLDRGNPAYNYVAAVRLTGKLDVGALERSLAELVRRHEVLRSRFPASGGQPTVEILPPTPIEAEKLAVHEADDATWSREWRRIAGDFARRPFDLELGPLFRVLLIERSAREHVLVSAGHHMVIDHLSVPVFVRELGVLYEAFTRGAAASLPELPVQYVDFAAWHRRRLAGKRLDELTEYWHSVFPDAPPPLDLPADRCRPELPSGRGECETRPLDAGLLDRLNSLGRAEGVTPYMTLLAAFATLLSRYTEQEDIVIGAPIDLRVRPELQLLVGFFVETLALRIDLSGNPTFRELLSRVQRRATDAYDHRDLPFDRLVKMLDVRRDLARTPLYQAMFLLVDAAVPPARIAGLTVEPVEVERGGAMTDVSLLVERRGEGAVTRLEYNTDLFDRERMRRMLEHYGALLEGIAADPDRRLSELPLLTDGERRRMLVEWNATHRPVPDVLIHELVEAQCRRTPDATALIWGTKGLTYRALDEEASRLARQLRRRGIGREAIVGICLDRSPRMVAALLATLKAGAAYLPLDPNHPGERLAAILADANAGLVLTEAAHRDRVPLDQPMLLLDAAADDDAAIDEHVAEPDARGEGGRLAYVLYTSGSTGQPKGVLVEHRSVVNHLSWAIELLGTEALHRVLSATSITFDPSVLEIFAPLSVGGAVVLARNALELPHLSACDEVTMMVTVPSVMSELLRLADLPASLGTVILGAEPLSQDLVRRVYRQRGVRRVFDFYGPTETTIASVVALRSDSDTANIGSPIANTQVFVLDRHGNPMPLGAAGELYIGGAGLARGYLNRPDLMAAAFVPNPLGEGRLYRTGDIVRFRRDGKLEFLGRRDHQVKVRGMRVELGEIEATLARHPSVREAVTAVHRGRGETQRIHAYVVPQGDARPPIEELRVFLRSKLPSYMVPSTITVLDRLPLTRTGKLDRSALTALTTDAAPAKRPYEAPRTPLEERLAAIWAEVLGVDRVGIDDDFFDLGGDSVLAIRMVARASEAGIHLSARHLLDHPTVAELAAAADACTAPRRDEAPDTGLIPLTPIQRWFLEPEPPDLERFALVFLLKAHKLLGAALLDRAFQQLVLHHDVLRMRLRRDGADWVQSIAPAEEARGVLSRADMSHLDPAAQRAAIVACADELCLGFDLARGPIVAARLFDLGPNERQRLMIAVHHFAFDFLSAAICLYDLELLYGQLACGEEPKLPARSTSFGAWARHLAEVAATGSLQKELAFWARQARNGDRELPTDFAPRLGALVEASSRRHVCVLEADETEAVLSLRARDPHFGFEHILLAPLVSSIARWSGSRQLTVDLVGHGREQVVDGVDLSRTVGWFTTLCPVRFGWESTASLFELLDQVRQRVAALPNHGIGYGMLRYLTHEAEVARQLSPFGDAEIAFDYVGRFDPLEHASLLFSPEPDLCRAVHGPRTPRRHKLLVSAAFVQGRLRIEWDYSSALHREETIRKLAQEFRDDLLRLTR